MLNVTNDKDVERVFENTLYFNTELRTWSELSSISYVDGIFTKIKVTDKSITQNEVKNYKSFVLPGLIDAHIHISEEPNYDLVSEFSLNEPIEKAAIRTKRNLQSALRVGVTTVRDLGSFEIKSLRIRNWLHKQGLLEELPRFLTTGGLLTKLGGHAIDRGIVIQSDNHILQTVERLVDLGVDGIKVINDPPVFSRKELTTISHCAHKNSLPIAVHVFTDNAARIALDSHVDSLEHVGYFSDDTIKKIKEQDIYVVPTFVAALDTVVNPITSMADGLFSDAELDIFKKWYQDECKILPKLWKLGVNLACGTDAGFPGTNCDSLIREMMCWRMFGIPMPDILRAATQGSAEAIGIRDKIGQISVGYSADYLVYKSPPTSNPQVLFSPAEVWCRGKRLR